MTYEQWIELAFLAQETRKDANLFPAPWDEPYRDPHEYEPGVSQE